MHPVKRLIACEPFQRLHAKGKFIQRKIAFFRQGTLFEPRQILIKQIFWAVYDTQVFAPTAFYGGLQQFRAFSGNEIKGFYNHPFRA